MFRRLITIALLTALAGALSLCAKSVPERMSAPDMADMGAARDYCDTTALAEAEGVWEYPEDETRVLIRRNASRRDAFDIVVIESPDCRLTPGDVIGSMLRLADPDKYEMRIFREKTGKMFANPGSCTATLDEKKGALFVEVQRVKFSLGTLWFLPRFWRTIRVGFRNPGDKLKKGLVRIYPPAIARGRYYL